MYNVLENIIEHIPLLVLDVWEKSLSKERFLDEIYKYIVEDIALNYDSTTFYLTKNSFGLPIDKRLKPSFISMIKWLTTQEQMAENIKNEKNMIHFRVYKDDVTLDIKTNVIRKKIFKEATHFVHRLDIIKYLIHKLIDIKNTRTKFEKTSDEYIDLCIIEYRIRSIVIEI
jgi:hypothetical protein